MRIISINTDYASGPFLEVEISRDESNITEFPHTIDITPIDDLSRAKSTRQDNLIRKLAEFGLQQGTCQQLIEIVREQKVNNVRFLLAQNE